MRVFLSAVVAGVIFVGPGAALAPPLAAQPGAGTCATVPVIHVYLDVSGSVFERPSGSASSGYQLALARLRQLAPQIEAMGATLRFHTFGARVNAPREFKRERDFTAYLVDIERNPPQRESSTDLSRVFENVLEQARDASFHAFYIFSDFAHSSLLGGERRSIDLAGGGQDVGESLRSWRTFVDAHGQAIRAVAQTTALRLVPLPSLDAAKQQQKDVLDYLALMTGNLFGRVIAADDEDAWRNVDAQLPLVKLRIEDGELRLRNQTCVTVRVVGLSVRKTTAPPEIKETPPHDLVPDGNEVTLPLPDVYARVGVVADGVQGPRLVSEEVSVQLFANDIVATGFLMGYDLQVFLVPKPAVAKPIDGQIEVLVEAGGGEGKVLEGKLQIFPNAERYPAPVSGRVAANTRAAVASTGRVRLRVTPNGGAPFEVPNVPVVVLPSGLFRLGLPVIGLVIAVGALGWSTYRQWPRNFTFWESVGSLLSLAGTGAWLVWFNAYWGEWAIRFMGLLVGLFTSWCAYLWLLPSEWLGPKGVERVVRQGSMEDALLRRRRYWMARVMGLLIGAGVGTAIGWFMHDGYVSLAGQRLPLEILQNVAKGVLQGQS